MHRFPAAISAFVLLAALATCATAPVSAAGQPAAPGCEQYDHVKQVFTDAGKAFREADAEQMPKILAEVEALTGVAHPKATRVFGAVLNGVPAVGIEEDGCLLPPIYLVQPGIRA